MRLFADCVWGSPLLLQSKVRSSELLSGVFRDGMPSFSVAVSSASNN